MMMMMNRRVVDVVLKVLLIMVRVIKLKLLIIIINMDIIYFLGKHHIDLP